MEEHNIVVDGDVIIGNHSNIKYGILTNSAILGERVELSGDLLCKSDVRIDIWSKIGGNVKTDAGAYLGEFVDIGGKLVVKGDLDIGNDVKINDGFEAKGWIVIRNPVPVIVYIFLYISELLRMGKDEEVEKALDELFEDETENLEFKCLIVPNGSNISNDSIRVPSNTLIHNKCRLVGNIRSTSFTMGDENILYGSIRTINDVEIGKNNVIHGNIVSRGNVHIGEKSHILGEINAYTILIHESARVDGVMRATEGIIVERDIDDEFNDNELIKLNL